jgi:hypothetical protein
VAQNRAIVAPPAARRARHEPGRLAFRACATFYAASLDATACHRLLGGLAGHGVRGEALCRRDLGIVSVVFGLDAATADEAQRHAEELLAHAGRDAGLDEARHALSVVRLPR